MVFNKLTAGAQSLGKAPRFNLQSVLEKVGRQHDLSAFLEITVEADQTLDFSGFDVRKHSGVLLDGVNDPRTLKRNREVLQGRPKTCKGASHPR